MDSSDFIDIYEESEVHLLNYSQKLKYRDITFAYSNIYSKLTIDEGIIQYNHLLQPERHIKILVNRTLENLIVSCDYSKERILVINERYIVVSVSNQMFLLDVSKNLVYNLIDNLIDANFEKFLDHMSRANDTLFNEGTEKNRHLVEGLEDYDERACIISDYYRD